MTVTPIKPWRATKRDIATQIAVLLASVVAAYFLIANTGFEGLCL